MNDLLPNKLVRWLANKPARFVAPCCFALAALCVTAIHAGEMVGNGSLRPVSAQAPAPSDIANAPLIELDGSISISPDGSELTYRWEQLSGPEVELSDPTSPKPQFRTNTPGIYEFQLVVSANGLDSEPHVVRLEIERENAPPVAKVMREAWGQVGKVMEVDGGDSFDPEGEELTFLWRAVTPGLEIPDEALRQPILVFEPNLDGVFEIELVVSDGEKISEPVRCVLSIKPRPRPPVAQARIVTVSIPSGATAAPVTELAAMPEPDGRERNAAAAIDPLPVIRMQPDVKFPSETKTPATAQTAPTPDGPFVASAPVPAVETAFMPLTAITPPEPIHPSEAPLTASLPFDPFVAEATPLKTSSFAMQQTARPPLDRPPPVGDLAPMAAPDVASWIPSSTTTQPETASAYAADSVYMPEYADLPIAAPPLPPLAVEPQTSPPLVMEPQTPMPQAISQMYPPAPKPVARITAPQTHQAGKVLMLDARNSYSPSGSRLDYFWRQVAGPDVGDIDVVFDGAAERFVPSTPGEYEFELVVSNFGVESDPVYHRVRVDREPDPPVAVVVAPTHALPGSLVKMDATQSYDLQGKPLIYRWRQTGGPKVTNYVIDERLGDSAPAFRPAQSGLYSFSLSVFNGTASSKPIDIDIDVTEAARRPPGLSIGGQDRAKVGERLVFNAVATDATGWNLTYSWQQVEGPAQALSPSGGIRAMAVPPVPGRYVFALSARDESGREVASANKTLEVPGGRGTGGGAPYVTAPSPVGGSAEAGPRRVPELTPLPNSQQTPMTFPEPQERGSGRGTAQILRGGKGK